MRTMHCTDPAHGWFDPECPYCYIEELKAELKVAENFHAVAVKERDIERIKYDRLVKTVEEFLYSKADKREKFIKLTNVLLEEEK